MNFASTDDFLINENQVYAFSVLREFLKTKKVEIEEEGEVIGEEVAALTAVKVDVTKDGKVQVRYEYGFEVEGEKAVESVELVITVGKFDEQLLLSFEPLSGNRLYYKKIVKEVKQLYANCLA